VSIDLQAEATTTRNAIKTRDPSYEGGLSIGHQWIFKDIISLDMFIGPRYLFSHTEFSWRGGITLEIAF